MSVILRAEAVPPFLGTLWATKMFLLSERFSNVERADDDLVERCNLVAISTLSDSQYQTEKVYSCFCKFFTRTSKDIVVHA